MSKKNISAESDSLTLTTYLTTLEDLSKWLETVKKDFPDVSLLSGHVSGYDGDEYTICFTVTREETDFEYANRLNKEKWEKKRIEDDEKETYRRLKAKFGDKE